MSLMNSKLLARLFLASTFFLLSVFSVRAQTTAARPDRGLMPNGSYAISDLEQISLTNGNLGLTIPLASLPPIAGGKLSWTIKAHYNSKIWNVNRQEMIGDRFDGSNVYYVVDHPQLSEQGNWRISGQYELEIREASNDFAYQLPPVADEPDYSLMLNNNWYRVVLRMPDGAKVVQTTDGIQRIQDTNGNKIKIYSDANGTHYQDEQTGREIRYKLEAGNQGRVYYKTVGNVEKYIAINFGQTNLVGQIYRVNDWVPFQFNFTPCTHYQLLNTSVPVIREIVLPESEPSVTRKFTFTYDSDSTESARALWCDSTARVRRRPTREPLPK